MNFKSSFLYAKRILLSKSFGPGIAQKSLVGALLCIGLSLIPLVVVLSVSNGMIEGITNRIISFSSSHIQAVCLKKEPGLLITASADARKVEGVRASYPMIEASALALSNSRRCGIVVKAIEPGVFKGLDSYRELFEATEGSIDDFVNSKNSVMIGKGIAQKLSARAGEKIRVVTIKKDARGKASPSIHFYNVAAIVSCGYRELDALWLFIPFDEGAKITRGLSASNYVMCELDDPFSPKIASVQASLRKTLGGDFKVYRWDQLNRAQYENFSSTKILLIFIQLLIVLVASVNISSALTMLSLERRREIAILKSLGASPSGVASCFLISGFACGLGGLLLGIPLGLLLSANINGLVSFFERAFNFCARGLYFIANNDIMGFEPIRLLSEEYYLQSIPARVPLGDLLLMATACLLLSLLASVFPALKAAKEKPLDTLRESR